ncbi:MORN repeat/PH domain containing protein, putative [Angomonas deanei]|uniref:MORN repeat/PH domain containing protein, putative n=1 Tax=Angomonas deanei TaxID=59799 RepID=A0A7G2CNC7_9TRYP|nr:MORN repeat/PH domain containing protein, putative [Angomonas deanei]
MLSVESQQEFLSKYADGEYDIPLKEGLHYQGHVANRLFNGEGTFTTSEIVFKGTFRDGYLHGKGTVVFKTPEASSLGVKVYEGTWKENSIVNGTAVFYSGDTYKGSFSNGKPVGEGEFFFADGRVYTGTFEDGKPSGQGRLTETNGDYYCGEFLHGEATGYGTAIYSKGSRLFTGLFEKGQKIRGKMEFPGCSRSYNGEWSDDKPQGRGEMKFANGDYYKGDFQAGRLHGVGLLVYKEPRGQQYYGQFFEDKPCGTGAFKTDKGVIAGFFDDGKLIPVDNIDQIEELKQKTRLLPSPQPDPPFVDTSTDNFFSTGGRSVSPANPTGKASTARSESVEGEFDEDLDLNEEDEDEEDEDEVSPFDNNASFPFRMDLENFTIPSEAASEGCKGWMEKCSIGRSKIKGLVSNWKRRYFILAGYGDSVCLGYYEDELCRKPVGFLRLNPSDTRIVTHPSPKTHKKASKPDRELCIIYTEKSKEYKLLLRTANAEEHRRWVAAFKQFFSIVDAPTDHSLFTAV